MNAQADVAAGLASVLVFAAERSFELDAAGGEGGSGSVQARPALAKGPWMLQQVCPRPSGIPMDVSLAERKESCCAWQPSNL